MGKIEKIKEEWVKLIGEFSYESYGIDENGYLRYIKPKTLHINEDLCEKHHSRIDWELWRPKTLNGIDTNNDWVSIKEDGLPKEEGYYWVVLNGRIYSQSFYKDDFSCWTNATHYQPVIEPKLPLY